MFEDMKVLFVRWNIGLFSVLLHQAQKTIPGDRQAPVVGKQAG